MDRYAAITAIILLGALGIPMPVPLAGLLTTAGIFAAHGELCVALLIGLAVGGAILGDTLGYASGRIGVRLHLRRRMVPNTDPSRPAHRLRQLAANMLASAIVTRAVGWSSGRLNRGGSMASLIVLSRTVLGAFGPVVNVLSGVRRYPIGRFLLYDAIGEVIWVGAFVGIGFAAGARGNDAADFLRNPIAIFVTIALTIVPMVIAARIKPAPSPLRRS
jgi:membrane-associated protein